jgi:iron complex transport system substrate-binding protein
MLKRFLLCLLTLLTLLMAFPAAAQEGQWPRTITDGLGVEVTINAAPQRIVSANLAADEILLPILGPERFAAVTAFGQDPAISNVAIEATQVENVIVAADSEQIISLQPDLVIAGSFTDPEIVQQLRDAGITVFSTDYSTSFEAIRSNIRLLGQAVGEEAAAETLIAEMDAEIESVVNAIGAPELAVRAMYLTPGNYTSGVASTISEIITSAGGVDVAAAAGIDQGVPVSDEFIIEQNPDVIILSGWTPYDPTFLDTFFNNPAFAGLSAVQNGRVYVGLDAHMSTVSQFISEGVKDTAAYLYPDLYPVFPVTITDAAGNSITIEEKPQNILVAPQEETTSPQDRILSALPADSFTVSYTGAAASETAIDLAFLTAQDAADFSDAAEQVVILYSGNTPAENVANMQLIGDALGERVIALEAIARYTDFEEALLAGEAG